MNRKAESVKFVVMIVTAFILIGLTFVTFGKNPTMTSKITYTEKECYIINDGKLSTAQTEDCCAQIKKSTGCKLYENNLFICEGSVDIAVNKETIQFCD